MVEATQLTMVSQSYVLDLGFKIDTRRHAVFFPESDTESEKPKTALLDDDVSTWDFVANATPPSRSNSESSSSSGVSAAQEIVQRYRAMHTNKRDSVSFADAVSVFTNKSILDAEARPARWDMKARFRYSRAAEIDQAAHEAFEVMHRCGLNENDQIVCQRPGCLDTLANVNALKFHLHIHNISDGIFQCEVCDGRFESSREADMHTCHRRHYLAATCPVRDGFKRMLSKIICCTQMSD